MCSTAWAHSSWPAGRCPVKGPRVLGEGPRVLGEGPRVLGEGPRVLGGAGKCVFVPAGMEHGYRFGYRYDMRNDSDHDWTVRVTYQQRIYPRHLGKLVSRSIRKRLGLVYR